MRLLRAEPAPAVLVEKMRKCTEHTDFPVPLAHESTDEIEEITTEGAMQAGRVEEAQCRWT